MKVAQLVGQKKTSETISDSAECYAGLSVRFENGMRELLSLSIFETNIRRVDLQARLVEDSGNCSNLCST